MRMRECFQLWVPKISLLFIPLGFIHPQENKNPKSQYFGQKKVIFSNIWCANIDTWPSLANTFLRLSPEKCFDFGYGNKYCMAHLMPLLAGPCWQSSSNYKNGLEGSSSSDGKCNCKSKTWLHCPMMSWSKIGNVLSTSFARASHLAPLSHLTFS